MKEEKELITNLIDVIELQLSFLRNLPVNNKKAHEPYLGLISLCLLKLDRYYQLTAIQGDKQD